MDQSAPGATLLRNPRANGGSFLFVQEQAFIVPLRSCKAFSCPVAVSAAVPRGAGWVCGRASIAQPAGAASPMRPAILRSNRRAEPASRYCRSGAVSADANGGIEEDQYSLDGFRLRVDENRLVCCAWHNHCSNANFGHNKSCRDSGESSRPVERALNSRLDGPHRTIPVRFCVLEIPCAIGVHLRDDQRNEGYGQGTFIHWIAVR